MHSFEFRGCIVSKLESFANRLTDEQTYNKVLSALSADKENEPSEESVTPKWSVFHKRKNVENLLKIKLSTFHQLCGRWDLNPHERNAHKILSLARLPVPTLPHIAFHG